MREANRTVRALLTFLLTTMALAVRGQTNDLLPAASAADMLLRYYPVMPAFVMPLAAGDGADLEIPGPRLRAFFSSRGVEFPAGSEIAFSSMTSTLNVRNTPDNLMAFERVLASINLFPPQVRVTLRVREVRADLPPEYADLEGFDGLERQMLANGQIVDVLTAAVTTVSGRRGSAQIDRTQTGEAPARITGKLEAGVLVGPDGYSVCLDLHARVRCETSAPREVLEKEIDTPCALWDGQGFRCWLDAAPPGGPAVSAKRPRRYVSIHVCLMSPAGEPIRIETERKGAARASHKEFYGEPADASRADPSRDEHRAEP